MDAGRCDICSCHSVPGRSLAYGATLKEPDGTLSAVCCDCYECFLPLSEAERRSQWPVNAVSHADAMRDSDPWSQRYRNASRAWCAQVAHVAIPGYTVVHSNEGLVKKLEFDQGRIIGASLAERNGLVTRDELTLDFNIHSDGTVSWEPAKDGRVRCHKCDKVEPEKGKYQACGGCRVLFYCGHACQKAHWPAHREACLAAQGVTKQ
jgi:hypothetical protein